MRDQGFSCIDVGESSDDACGSEASWPELREVVVRKNVRTESKASPSNQSRQSIEKLCRLQE